MRGHIESIPLPDASVEGAPLAAVREDVTAWVGCVAGAMKHTECLNLLQHVGFGNASIEPTRVYRFADLQASACASPTIDALPAKEKTSLDGHIFSAFIRAIKPV